jgi:hypothetical protein
MPLQPGGNSYIKALCLIWSNSCAMKPAASNCCAFAISSADEYL